MYHKSSLYSCFFPFLSVGEGVKPFPPENTKEIVMSLQQPAVFCNMVGDWPALRWNAGYLSALLGGRAIQFRLGLKAVDLGEHGQLLPLTTLLFGILQSSASPLSLFTL